MVATRQLLALGFNKAAIQVRVRRGQLHRIYRGVYAVGHAAVTLRGRFMAAVLACGEDAFLARFSAGSVDGYLKWDDRRPEVLVLGSAREQAGIRIHRARVLDERDVRRNLTIPRTTVARTLLDLADDLPERHLRRAVREAQASKLVNVRAIGDVLTRSNGRRGAPRLAALFAEGHTPTRSDLEDLVLDVIDRGGIQRPEINRRLGRDLPRLQMARAAADRRGRQRDLAQRQARERGRRAAPGTARSRRRARAARHVAAGAQGATADRRQDRRGGGALH